jgi:ubiquinone/menaquinone biosynthesis C-methylase UbiE
MNAWLRTALRQMARVTKPGGHVVLLAPRVPAAVLPPSLELAGSFGVRLLGVNVTTWHYRRL